MITIDATGKKLGRVASEAARHLMNKMSPSYERNEAPDIKVTVINCSKADIEEKKKKDTVYRTYTGFRGGLKEETLEKLIQRKSYTEAFKKAIYGMVPRNKLTKIMMKNLTLKD